MSPLATTGPTVPDSFIKIPHAVVRDTHYSDSAVLLYAALCNHPGDLSGWIRKPHAHLARYLGWDTNSVKTDSAAKRVARAIKQLVTGRLIQVRWIREGLHKVPTYRVTPRSTKEPFEALPRTMFKAACHEELSRDGATMMRHWLLWRMSAGAAGWTRPDCKTLATRCKLTAKAVARRLEQLAAAGWVRIINGVGGEALRFPHAPQASCNSPIEPALEAERSVHQPPAGNDDEVSTINATKCPARSSHPSSDHPSNDPSVGASATTVESVEGRDATADEPPRTNNPRRDTHHAAACRIINAQPHLAGNHLTRVRHKAIAMLTKRLRTAATTPRPINPAKATAYIADRLDQAAQEDTLNTNHCQLIRQALANLRADTLAALDTAPTTSTATPQTTPCLDTIVVPEGPQLEDLAALPAPSRRQVHDDPALAVEAVAADLARWLLSQLESDPDSDVDHLLSHAQSRLERTMAGTPYQVAASFAPGLVRRAYHRSILQQQADELADLDELRRIHELAIASLAQARTA